jgi:hypothetical protein
MPMVRHFLLSVGVPAAARKMLGRLVSGDAAVEVDVLYTDNQVAIGGKYLITAQDCSASCLRQR